MLYILDPNSDFLCLIYLSLGIILTSIAHPLQGLGDFQDRVIIVLSMHTPTEYQCLGTVQAQNAIMYMCDVMGH